jgi:hypothetical protein
MGSNLDPVSRPTFAGDISPGMRIYTSSGFGTFGPATVLPDGLVELGGGLVAVKAMWDDGQIGVLTLPACQAVMELVEVPPLDDGCDCGELGCAGAWPTLDHDPHPLGARGRRVIDPATLIGASAFSVAEWVAAGTRDCDDERCCPTDPAVEKHPGTDCSDRPDPSPPYEPGGYL